MKKRHLTLTAAAKFRDNVADLHVQMERATFDTIQDDRVGKLLTNGKRDENVLPGQDSSRGAIGVPVYAIENGLAATANVDGGAVVSAGFDVGIDAGTDAGDASLVDPQFTGA